MRNSRQFVPAPGRNKRTAIVVVVLILAVLFAIPATRSGIRKTAGGIGLGIVRITHGIGGWFASIGTTFRSKAELEKENQNLKDELAGINEKLLSYDSLATENESLKTSMGRSGTSHFILAAVLEKPSHSAYDTIVIDGGGSVGISVAQTVFANGEIPIGTIEKVFSSSALVRLFSSPKQSTEAELRFPGSTQTASIGVTLTGRGGGNFQTTVPRDISMPDGTLAYSKGLNSHIIATFQKVTSDARDPFQTLLLVAPVNVQALHFVQVEQN